MTSDKFGKRKQDRQIGMLADLRNIYDAGNPTALNECLSYCQESQLPLPGWIVSELQQILQDYFVAPRGGAKGRHAKKLQRYRDYLSREVRIEAYRTVRRWQEDITRYEDMPTQCIELWCQGKIEPKPATKSQARKIALMGLEGTYFHCSDETFRRLAMEYDKQVSQDQQQPQNYDPNHPISSEEFQSSILLFCKWDTEIDYGFRKKGSLFGSSSKMPEKIKKQIDEAQEAKSSQFKGI